MYKPDDENVEQAVEETGVLQENDINEPVPQNEDPVEALPEAPIQEAE